MLTAGPRPLTRRRLLALLGAAGFATACSGGGGSPSSAFAPAGTPAAAPKQTWRDVQPVDFSARFAQFPVADEPNADPAKVTWPAFVERAGGDVKRLYEFQLANGDLMKYMPCFCGCGRNNGHKSNRDCYVQQVKPDGSAVFDPMAPTWDICLGVTRAVTEMKAAGLPQREMRMRVDALYKDLADDSTPTPYPPA